MKVAARTRWYIRVLQFSPIVAALLLAFVLLAVPTGLRAQIDTVREHAAIAKASGEMPAGAYDERIAAEQWLATARQLGTAPTSRFWQQVQVFLALRQSQLLGGAAMLLAMALVASPAAFILERRRITQFLVLEEMERVQQDAHDKVYNRLSALSKRVEMTGEALSSEVGRSLEQVADDIRDTVSDLQEILGDVRQRTASLTGTDPLRSQLESVAREQAARLGVVVDLAFAGDMPPLSAQTGWDLQCVLEEAISNAVEHGGATRVVAGVAIAEETLVMRIEDNGSGMSGADVDGLPEEHLGLRGMRNRAERHGGAFAVEPAEKGAALVIHIPVKGNQGDTGVG